MIMIYQALKKSLYITGLKFVLLTDKFTYAVLSIQTRIKAVVQTLTKISSSVLRVVSKVIVSK
jgi:hypothetical protein